MSLPTTQKALVIDGPKKASVKTTKTIPKLRPDYILVKVHAIALNPTDWKHLDYMPSPGHILGCDYSGTVVAVGDNVTKSWKPGDRVAGGVHGSNALEPEDGAFAQYIVAKGDVQMRMPDKMSFEEAATLGIGCITVGQALYQNLKLPKPDSPDTKGTTVLIYGGSTATGTLAIQFAKLSGLRVLTTCSKHNFDLVKSLGADEVFDYSSSSCGKDISKATSNGLQYAFDTISTDDSQKICYEGLSTTAPAHYASLLAKQSSPRKLQSEGHTLAYSFTGEMLKFGETEIPAKPEDLVFGTIWATEVEKLLAEGKIKVHPIDIRKGGLAGIEEGLE
jgi:NADPH:quinone reductase-like Zn-dependent oxidoreductase